MNYKKRIHINHIQGLWDIVIKDIRKIYPKVTEIKEGYIECIPDSVDLHTLQSAVSVHMQYHAEFLTPPYLSKHIDILDDLIQETVDITDFKTFSFSIAGKDTQEVRKIKTHIGHRYGIKEDIQGDLNISLGKKYNEWVLSCRTTSRPLTVRDWRAENIPGGLNPSIAYCMNVLTQPSPRQRYLNIFSGSATLLIERAKMCNANELLGFDNNGKTNSLAIRNIKKAGFVNTLQIRTHDIYESPNLGTFDVITSDLPFGIDIGKDTDLSELYNQTLKYIYQHLDKDGIAVIYTEKTKILEDVLNEYTDHYNVSNRELKVPTSSGGYFYPKIYILRMNYLSVEKETSTTRGR